MALASHTTRRWFGGGSLRATESWMLCMLLQACLNGSRRRDEHAALPTSPEELATAAWESVQVGASALHVHPRRADGAQSLNAESQAAAIAAIRQRCPGVPVGVSTAIWIEPDARRRLALVQTWTVQPDYASVNFDEPGAEELCAALLARGVGVEAGLASPADASRLLASGLAPRCLRLLIETPEDAPFEALATAQRIIETLDAGAPTVSRLLHGAEDATWPVLERALQLGYDTRIGFEDTLRLPDGQLADSNSALVGAAVTLARSLGRM